MKQWYTAKELEALSLPGLPESKSGILRLAKQHKWESQQSSVKGGVVYEFNITNFPKETIAALRDQHNLTLIKRMSLAPVSVRENRALATALIEPNTSEQQRTTASARGMVLKAIEGMASAGVSKEAAINLILTQAKLGTLADSNPVLDKALRDAVDSRGKTSDKAYPSPRTIKRWASDANSQGALVPSYRQKEPLPKWLGLFRKFYNIPEKPSLASAYDDFLEAWASPEQPPSIYAVRRAMDKLGQVEREKGRMGQNEIANIKGFKRRSFDKLLPADVYSADGHTFDGEVAHPLHGRPFRPEITTFIDIATRKVVGVSVTLAESGLAVLDALMDSCKCGVPALLYVDNGSGYVNEMLKDETKGILARLGTEMTHSLPYNSKARGVIERVHQTLWVAGAKKLPNFVGKDMDRQARLANFKDTRNAQRNDGVVPILSWSDFMAWVHERVEWYNKRPHSSLPKIKDNGVSRHESPQEVWQRFIASGWEPDMLDNEVIAHIFRPQVERTVLRGEIRLFNNRYFSNDLEEWHGLSVNVAYDIHDPNRVWAFEPETGRMIASADFAANETDYFPQSVVDRAREKRAEGRLKRAMVRVDEIEAERTGTPVIEHQSFVLDGFDTNGPTFAPVQHEQDYDPFLTVRAQPTQPKVEHTSAVPIYESLDAEQRYQLYQDCQRDPELAFQHQGWLRNYPKSKEFQYFKAQA
ncbi:Mu transposase C-terminal domain-containing protein [Marinomonas fungiae]|uniref:Mu transposase, C-terminal/Mu DNA-binding domain/Integrase core domain n=1 Tax=Marinomonas fungiae TaxID=1137284 RepID=A0A0K6IU69_9GAMM|nr:Mu transposase C-terminal domain-containing protein [Marinomonas fungiae]CUB06650.1 Mu transposase, C-terminal/Mu DNA-binding domain/Integrase core domain [Marinomonas fungiae]